MINRPKIRALSSLVQALKWTLGIYSEKKLACTNVSSALYKLNRLMKSGFCWKSLYTINIIKFSRLIVFGFTSHS